MILLGYLFRALIGFPALHTLIVFDINNDVMIRQPCSWRYQAPAHPLLYQTDVYALRVVLRQLKTIEFSFPIAWNVDFLFAHAELHPRGYFERLQFLKIRICAVDKDRPLRFLAECPQLQTLHLTMEHSPDEGIPGFNLSETPIDTLRGLRSLCLRGMHTDQETLINLLDGNCLTLTGLELVRIRLIDGKLAKIFAFITRQRFPSLYRLRLWPLYLVSHGQSVHRSVCGPGYDDHDAEGQTEEDLIAHHEAFSQIFPRTTSIQTTRRVDHNLGDDYQLDDPVWPWEANPEEVESVSDFNNAEAVDAGDSHESATDEDDAHDNTVDLDDTARDTAEGDAAHQGDTDMKDNAERDNANQVTGFDDSIEDGHTEAIEDGHTEAVCNA